MVSSFVHWITDTVIKDLITMMATDLTKLDDCAYIHTGDYEVITGLLCTLTSFFYCNRVH